MDILQFYNSPFQSLPINGGDLLDLTGEFLRAKLIAAGENYQQIISLSSAITADTLKFQQDDKLFNAVDDFISGYAQIIRCIQLSLGMSVGELKKPTQVFQPYGYNNANPLHINIKDLRNTSEHFEERLQMYGQQAEPFLQISYSGIKFHWEARFGVGGYHKSGGGVASEEQFDEKKLSFHSYKVSKINGSKTIETVDISLSDVILDIQQIALLLKLNLDNAIQQKGKWCAPVRNISAVITPDNEIA